MARYEAIERPVGDGGPGLSCPHALVHAASLALIRGADELTDRHEAAHFAQVPQDELRIDLVRGLESLPSWDGVQLLYSRPRPVPLT
jgi:hypothetical protein